MGIFPVGTLLKLDTGAVGVVIKKPENGVIGRPLIQLLSRDNQKQYKKGMIVSLAEKDPQTGRYYRNISESIHPSTEGIQPAAFLV